MTQPPAPRSSPLALTVLALLHYQPLHPYGIQRLIKQWGKDQVVNVEQRTSLYRTIERLLAAGLIAVRETGRDPRYPERTVYEVTEAGRQTARRWLEEMLAEPRQEYPEFPAALSHVLMLEPAELAEVLERRARRLAAMLAALDANTAAEAGHGLPRIAMLENEYQRAVLAAEARWVAEKSPSSARGELTWSRQAELASPGSGPRARLGCGCRTPPCLTSTARAAAPVTTPTWCRAPAPADPRCWPATTWGRSQVSPRDIAGRPPDLWRYHELLPVRDGRPRGEPRRGDDAAARPAASRPGARRAEPADEGRGPDPDRHVQGARRRGGRLPGRRARRLRDRHADQRQRRGGLVGCTRPGPGCGAWS